MFTTGFKTFFGYAVFAFFAAILYGYASGGNGTGPISLGYKGGVGDHAGYGILLFTSLAAGAIAGVLVFFRDADAEQVANYMGVAEAPIGQRPTAPNFWPLVGAVGVGLMVVGLVSGWPLFAAGVILVSVVIVEWMMSAWADRATGDPVANKALRDQVMQPFEVPILGFAAIALLVLAMSRIFLAVSATGAVVAAGLAAVLIFGTAVLLNFRPTIPKNLAAGLLVLGCASLLVGGIVAAAIGEREFHEENPHDEPVSHGDEG